MKSLIVLCLLIARTSCLFLSATETYQVKPADYLQQSWRWQTLEKLDHLNVVSMCESPSGDIWFGNDGSIAKFDGKQFTVYPLTPQLIDQIRDNRIAPLCQDIVVRNNNTPLFIVLGNLVAHTEQGWDVLYKRNPTQGGSKKIITTKDNSIWLLNHHTLFKFDPTLKSPTLCHKLEPHQEFLTFCTDHENTIWIIQNEKNPTLIKIPTFDGLPLAQNKWKEYPLPVQSASASAELEVNQNNELIYVDRLENVSVQKFNPKNESWSIAFDTTLKRHHALHIDHAGSIWLGSQSSLFKYQNNNGKLYQNENWLPQTIVEELIFDRQQRLWLRDRSNRVHVANLNNHPWSTLQDLHFHCEDSQGIQWFTNKHGNIVSKIQGDYQIHEIKIGNFGKIVSSSHGLTWALTTQKNKGRLFVYRDQKWDEIQEIELSSISEDSFCEAPDGSIWIAASTKETPDKKGLLQWKVTPEKKVILTKYTPDLAPRIYQCSTSKTGLLYLGGFALYCYNPAEDKLEMVSELPYRKVSSLTHTSDGALWVAQVGMGVYKFHHEKWTHYNIKDGLASNNVVQLLALDNGELLAASRNGISRFDGKHWVSQVYPKDIYLVNNGGSLRRDASNTIWINITEKEILSSGDNTSKAFITHQIKPDPYIPDTSILYYNSQISHKSSGFISWTGHDHWLDNNNELQYSWRLNGGEWSDFSFKKEQAFLDLNEGQYEFEVRSRDASFNIDPSPAKITFTVLAPIWKQPWFIFLILTLLTIIVVLIFTLIKARERHLLEKQKEQEKHWAELDQIKTVFFSNITHELRTPLTVVLSRLESLFSKENDEAKKRLMAVMLRNVNRISILISQLLDFKKIEEHNIRLESTEGDIGLFIKDVVDRSKPFAEDHQCQLSCQGECYGWFDPDKLDKIITNLLSNAVKYSPHGGQINLIFKQIQLESKPILTLSVEDHGCGMEAEQLKHIFERFYRVSKTSRTEGVGIGLNLTKELVDLWGGSITAESPIHQNPKQPGTRITVQLPLERQETRESFEASGDPIENTGSSHQQHLLIVEDDAEIRSALSDELSQLYQISLADNGREGIEKAKDLMPDLILTDLMMPDMDGLQLCHQLKSDQLTSHIPIIMLTAKASLDSQMEGLEKGADDYITKPFHISHVKKRVENILNNYQRLKEKFARHYMLPDQPLPEDTVDKEFLENVFRILENEVKDVQFDAEGLAQKLHMSLSTLRRKLKAVTDDTPAKLIRDMRLKMGAALLIKSDLNVTQIALEVGFAESNHFARLFKAFYNQTPTQYRSQHSSEKEPIS